MVPTKHQIGKYDYYAMHYHFLLQQSSDFFNFSVNQTILSDWPTTTVLKQLCLGQNCKKKTKQISLTNAKINYG